MSSWEGEQTTVVAIAYSVMRAHDAVRGKCVNCHVEDRTREGNDPECASYRDCQDRVYTGMQATKRTPATVRVRAVAAVIFIAAFVAPRDLEVQGFELRLCAGEQALPCTAVTLPDHVYTCMYLYILGTGQNFVFLYHIPTM